MPVLSASSLPSYTQTFHDSPLGGLCSELLNKHLSDSDGGGSAGSSAALLKATQGNAVNDLNLTELPGKDDGGNDSASEA